MKFCKINPDCQRCLYERKKKPFADPKLCSPTPAKANVCSIFETFFCSYNKYDQSQGGYEEAVMMGDPPAKEYNTYMMQVMFFVTLTMRC